jgi:hypothetical protein
MTDPSMMARLKGYNWHKALKDAESDALDHLKRDAVLSQHHVGFALLRTAATTSRLSYSAPPRPGWPSKSALPDSVDDVTQWQLISAYLKGELASLPDIENRMPRPSSDAIDQCDLVLHVWHHYALPHKGDRSRIKRAVYLRANGAKPNKIAAVTGINVRQLRSAAHEAGQDIFDYVVFLNKC